MTSHNDDFNRIVNEEWEVNTTPAPATPAHGPYGPAAQQQVKTGLTPRGKAALAIGATVIAGGSLLGWQHYEAAQTANEVRAQELALEQQKLDIEQMKTEQQVNQAADKQQAVADKTRQKKIDACVDADKGLIGKRMGTTYSSILNDCRNQYPASSDGADMQAAGSARDTDNGFTNVVLIGGAAIAVVLLVGVRKATRPQAAPVYYQTHP